MWLRKAANSIDRWLSPLTNVVGGIGSGIIVMMVMLTVADVVGRRVFNNPILGVYETSKIMLVIVVAFGIAHCELLRAHVSIGLIVSRLKQRAQDVIDSVMYLFFLITFCLLTYQLCRYGLSEWSVNALVEHLEIPIFPFIFAAAFGFALLSLLVLMRLLLLLVGALKK